MSDMIITKIDARPTIPTSVPNKRQRVAAYTRVSTDKDEQEDSFERQVEYYTKHIQENEKWVFVKIYCDPGISGIRADKRPGFQELMKDCRLGKIDKILCKSISRFSRNTVDALNYIRELKDLGIGVVFETQNIDTNTPGGDVLLTILAATAEEESRTISKNIKWAMQKKFEKGDFMLNYNRFLGYTRDNAHNLVIVPEEAKIVLRIYSEYISGSSTNKIASGLMKDGVLSPDGKEKWHNSTILSMLKNEKYTGCALMMKTYKPDVLSKIRIKNNGQYEQYYAENTHPAIISKSMFEEAKREMARRHKVRTDHPQGRGMVTNRYPFSQKIRCGVCGSQYVRGQIYDHGNLIPAWWCYSRRRSQKLCSQKGISERSLENAFVECLNLLVNDFDEVKQIVKESVTATLTNVSLSELENIEGQIRNLQREMMELHAKRTNGRLLPDAYGKQGSKLAKEIDELKIRKEKLIESKNAQEQTKKRLEDIFSAIDSFKLNSEFNPIVFRNLIEEVTINDRNRLTFKFKVGITKTILAQIK